MKSFFRWTAAAWFVLAACVTPKPSPTPATSNANASESSGANPSGVATAEKNRERELAERERDRPGARLRVWHLDSSADEHTLVAPSETCDRSSMLTAIDLDARRGDFGSVPSHWFARIDTQIARSAQANEPLQLRLRGGSSTRVYLDERLILRGPNAEIEVTLDRPRTTLTVVHAAFGEAVPLVLEVRTSDAQRFEPLASPRIVPADPNSRVGPLERRVVDLERIPATEPATTREPREHPPGLHPSFERSSPTSLAANTVTAVVRTNPADWLAVVGSDIVRGDLADLQNATRVAAGLEAPLDTALVDGRTFVLQRHELTELIDIDRDGRTDEYRSLWNVPRRTGELAFEARALCEWRGSLFVALALLSGANASTSDSAANRGVIMRVDPRSGEAAVFATLRRAPNHLSSTAEHLVLSDDRAASSRTPSSALVCFDFDGRRAGEVHWPNTRSGAAREHDLGRLSGLPTGPFAQQALVWDSDASVWVRVAFDRHANSIQGAVFPFEREDVATSTRGRRPSQRIVSAGDGTAYVFAPSNQNGAATRVHRLLPRAAVVFDWIAVQTIAGGFELEFNAPLQAGVGGDPTQFEIESRSIDGEARTTDLVARAATVSADRKRIVLTVDGLQARSLIRIALPSSVVDDEGWRPWSSFAWYTLLEVWDRPARADQPAEPSETPLEANPSRDEQNWTALEEVHLLHDAPSISASAGWSVSDGVWSAQSGARMLATRDHFAEFELEFEWRVEPGGRGSVAYAGAVYALVDELTHLDGLDPLRVSGAALDEFPPKWLASRAAGEWNAARILVRGRRVEHWLNGRPVLAFERAPLRGPLRFYAETPSNSFRNVRWRSLEP